MIEDPGGVPEWLNGAVSKTVDGGNVVREFESLPLRYVAIPSCRSSANPILRQF
jgi:hypothetical protein